MSIRDEILNDKSFLIKTLIISLGDERARVLSSNLATEKQLSSLIEPAIEHMQKSGTASEDSLINVLSSLYNSLVYIKLPEDINKYAYDYTPSLAEFNEWEKQEEVPNVVVSRKDPNTGEWWTRLSDGSLKLGKLSYPKGKEIARQQLHKLEEGFRDTVQNWPIVSDLFEKKPPGTTQQRTESTQVIGKRGSTETLINVVNSCLYKIARSLADDGNHEATYLVERTIRDISSINRSLA